MINASEDLEKAISYVLTETDSDIRSATGVLSSVDINATMNSIE